MLVQVNPLPLSVVGPQPAGTRVWLVNVITRPEQHFLVLSVKVAFSGSQAVVVVVVVPVTHL